MHFWLLAGVSDIGEMIRDTECGSCNDSVWRRFGCGVPSTSQAKQTALKADVTRSTGQGENADHPFVIFNHISLNKRDWELQNLRGFAIGCCRAAIYIIFSMYVAVVSV